MKDIKFTFVEDFRIQGCIRKAVRHLEEIKKKEHKKRKDGQQCPTVSAN
jgi:hypothetical protein